MQTMKCGRFTLALDRARIMGIVNLTDDSFSGDGMGSRIDAALRRAEEVVREGADILDLGGESSRPGAEPVPEQQELDRVIPLVERLAGGPVPVSIDTVKTAVMRAALRAGASMINDINSFRASGAIEAVLGTDAALCVMHMQGEPRSMQSNPRYESVVGEVLAFLDARVGALRAAGVSADRLAIDPGFGFGKTLEHNLELFRALDRFVATGLPVLIGVSRKSMIGTITGRPVGERASGSVAAAMMAVERGARIVRVHDVAATRDALAVLEAVEGLPVTE